MWNTTGESGDSGDCYEDTIFKFSDIDESLSGWDLVRDQMPKIVRQNAFNINQEVTGIEDIYRSVENLSDILNGVNLNDNVIIDNQPVVSVKIDILSEKKVKLIFDIN